MFSACSAEEFSSSVMDEVSKDLNPIKTKGNNFDLICIGVSHKMEWRFFQKLANTPQGQNFLIGKKMLGQKSPRSFPGLIFHFSREEKNRT